MVGRLEQVSGFSQEQIAMNEEPWQILSGLHPANSNYPARVKFNGETIIIFRTKTGFRGVERSCPHMQATMMNAELAANDTMIRCPLHVFTFKLSDGKGVNCPGFWLKVYEIREEDGALFCRSANKIPSEARAPTRAGLE